MDARRTIIKELRRVCENKIELVSYETDGRNPNLNSEETCLQLVRNCEAIIVLLDQYYGTLYDKNISITHAEVKEALNKNSKIIPIVRTETWHEFLVWKKNPGIKLNFNHVEEPALFKLIEELYSRKINFQIYDEFTSTTTLLDIANSIFEILKNESIGSIQHIALPDGQYDAPKINNIIPLEEIPAEKQPTKITSISASKIQKFESGSKFTHKNMNDLIDILHNTASKRNVSLTPQKRYKAGSSLTSSDMNNFVENITTVYNSTGLNPPKWSFSRFRDGDVLRASYMNEIVEAIRKLEST